MAFDYRGFGTSEGKRGRLVPQEQVEDVRAAASFLKSLPEVDPEAISLVGWALGGGVAIASAADNPLVRSVVAINAIGDGGRAVRSVHDTASWRALIERLDSDRMQRAVVGTSELVPPFEIVRLDPATQGYVDAELYKTVGFGSDVSLESADYLLRFRPVTSVEWIAPRPLLLIHGSDNQLHAPEEAHDLYVHAGLPKRLVFLKGCGHTEWAYDENPNFRRVVELIHAFLSESLDGAAT